MATPTSTQVSYPWRATARTAVAAFVAMLPLVPVIVPELPRGAARLAGVTAFVALCATVTRVLAIPAVNAWIHTYAPWLAPQPPEGPSS